MKQELILDYIPCDLNTYIRAERTNKYLSAKIKKEETEKVCWICKSHGLKLMGKPVRIVFTWYLKNKRKDPDNICFSKKFIMDGMVQAGVLIDDAREYITEFHDLFKESEYDQVVIELIEI